MLSSCSIFQLNRKYASRVMRMLVLTIILLATTSCTDSQRKTLTGNTNTSTASITMKLVDPVQPTADDYYEVNEGNGTFALRFQLSQPLQEDFRLSYTARSDTVTGGEPAKLSKDFIVNFKKSCQSETQCDNTGIADVPAGTVDFTISIAIIDDSFYEGDELFYIGVSIPDPATAGMIAISKNVFDVRIKDNELDPPNFVFVANQGQIFDVNEGTGIATVKIISTTSYSDRYSYKIPISYNPTVAAAGQDFIATTFFEIPAAQNVGVIPEIFYSFQIVDDVVPEGSESVAVTLGTPTGATVGSPNAVVFNIVDDDGSLSVGLNSTGITLCTNGAAQDAGSPCNPGDVNYPGQDGHFGAIFDGANFAKWDSKNTPTAGSPWKCVLDNRTGLVWEVKSADAAATNYYTHTYSWYDTRSNVNGGNSGSGGVLSTSTGTTAQCLNLDGQACDTKHYIDKLNAMAYCGYTTWRLPRVNELVSLLRLSLPQVTTPPTPYLPESVFNPTGVETGKDYLYWTSTPVVGDVKMAWGVRFNSLTNALEPITAVLSKDSYQHIRLVTGK